MTLETVMLYIAILHALGTYALVFGIVLHRWSPLEKWRVRRAKRVQLLADRDELTNRAAACRERLNRLRPIYGVSPAHELAYEMTAYLAEPLDVVERTIGRIHKAIESGMSDDARELADYALPTIGYVEIFLGWSERRLPEAAAYHSSIASKALEDVIGLRDFAFERWREARQQLGVDASSLDEEWHRLQMLSNAFVAVRTIMDTDPDSVLDIVMKQRAFIKEIVVLMQLRVEACRYVRACAASAAAAARLARFNLPSVVTGAEPSFAQCAMRAAAGIATAERAIELAIRLVKEPSVQIGMSSRTRRRLARATIIAGRADATLKAIDLQIDLLRSTPAERAVEQRKRPN